MSRKKSVEWHEECFRNMVATLRGYENEEAERKKRIVRLTADIEQLRQQICEAKKRGLDGFDSERFLVPRKKKA